MHVSFLSFIFRDPIYYRMSYIKDKQAGKYANNTCLPVLELSFLSSSFS